MRRSRPKGEAQDVPSTSRSLRHLVRVLSIDAGVEPAKIENVGFDKSAGADLCGEAAEGRGTGCAEYIPPSPPFKVSLKILSAGLEPALRKSMVVPLVLPRR